MPGKHTYVTRECPGCGEVKLFQKRSRFCSIKCAGNLRRKGAPLQDGPKNTREDEFTATSWTIKMESDRVKTFDELVAHCKVDLSLWEVERFKVKSYEVTYVPRATRTDDTQGWIRNTSQAITVPMFALCATLKKRMDVVVARNILDDLKKNFSYFFPKRLDSVYPAPLHTGNVLELNISDHHFGKLAWGKETGGKDWDLGLAKQSWRDAVSYIVSGTSHHDYEEAILVVGNDVVHVDGKESSTTAGTRVDSDSRYPRVYLTVVGEIVWTVRTLRSRGMRVRVVIVPGNHDEVSCFTIGVALTYAFQGDDGVIVDNAPTSRKVYAFGKVLLGWEHGHEGKHKQRPLNLAVEHPDLWGSTEHREIHTGHEHHMLVEDIQGVIVRKLAALGPNDAWHAKHGYGAQRNAEAFMWNKESGLMGTCTYIAPSGRKLLKRAA